MAFYLLCFLLLGVQGSWGFSLNRPSRQVDDCSPVNVDPSQCQAYWSGQQKPPLLIISLDGFRAEYLNREAEGEPIAPTISRLARCGVWASDGMMPSYPTLTFPNHFSIVTGLYPESHGIVANSFYDPDLQSSFSLSSHQQQNSLWWKGEPIWNVAKQQNKTTATFFWPGSDQNDPLELPSYWFLYNTSITYEYRVDQVFHWLMLPVAQRPNLLNLYFDEPDHTGHSESPNSPLVDDKIRAVDQQIKRLLDSLEGEGVLGCIDIILLADHGMASSPPGEKFLIMEELLPNISRDARIYDGVLPTIRPNIDTEEERDRIASAFECKDAHMQVYNKWELPRRFHYSKPNSIPSILLDMSVEWRAYRATEYKLPGNHGWNNINPEMQALFVAQGPSFKKGIQVRPFQNIELYNLMCAMIGINPGPNNGTWGALHHFLVSPPADPLAPPVQPPARLSYPENQATYDDHLKRNKCDLLTGSNEPSIDSTMNLDQAGIDQSVQTHTPWGSPQFNDAKSNSQVKVLVSKDSVSGFNVVTGLPSWTSYTLKQTKEFVLSKPNWRLDVRLQKNSKSICDRGAITNSSLVQMFPFGSDSNKADMAVDTNAIEISANFEKYWIDFQSRLGHNVVLHGETNVIIGPIRDSSSPSLFIIVSNCNNSALADCGINQLNVQSFILPTHLRYNGGCIAFDDMYRVHIAGVRDVEQITGLHFFPTLSYRDKVDILSRTPFASSLLIEPRPPHDKMIPTSRSERLIGSSSFCLFLLGLVATKLFA